MAIDPGAIDQHPAFEARLERLLDQLTRAPPIPDAPGPVLMEHLSMSGIGQQRGPRIRVKLAKRKDTLCPSTLVLALGCSMAMATTYAPAAAADPWVWQNPQLQGSHLYGSAIPRPGTLVAVGMSGTVVRSTDAGLTWTVLKLGNEDLFAVSFADSDTGVALVDENTATAVGALGTILRTTDGGLSWTQQPTGYSAALRAVSFSGSTGYIVGDRGVILRSEDAGATWIEQPFTHLALLGVRVIDQDAAVIVGDGEAILRTDTGGR
jgi:photosystem II stability/assembly factor-like uncharacterized protein